MQRIGYDHYETYPYYDIINFNTCHDCKYFFDNELATQFECHRSEEPDHNGATCYVYKYDLPIL